ncbi:(d)CMP kinase [Clostridium ihumii]|uniref:(d)CMP kinase n=1 Tax=Clostridium ihumii TaxID=1470356 RepID=UPI000590BA0F|nr:(d)CMP kinase [Clostridium ihumii]
MSMSVAIDGPAGAGKSTIAKIVGEKFNLMYINTGSMYRAITYIAMNKNISPSDKQGLMEVLNSVEMHFDGDNLILNGEDITEKLTMPVISNNVSNYAKIPEVREKLVKMQQDIAKKYDVIMDGRDIGTVVLKDSKFKYYLTATAETRAQRRFEELKSKNIEVNFNDLLEDIKKRDYIDSTREKDPLVKADDAIEIDSSNLGIDDVVEVISNNIKEKISK